MPSKLSPEEYQELGKSYYKFKQYEKAIEAFTHAIEASQVPTATLYDYRAASYEKLADFNSAVKDGRLAIRTHKQDVKGYLRTASALQKMNKLDTALNIYKYGMKNVPAGNKDFELLQQLHDRLTRKLSPPKSIDPFTVLPVELVEMIIGYLPFKDMVGCLRVSKGWKGYLTSRPNLWSNIDLSGATNSVSRTFLDKAVRYSQNTLHTLTAHRIQHNDILRNIATQCQCLHTLTLMSFPHLVSDTLIQVAHRAHNLRSITVQTQMSMDTATQILRRRPDLEHIKFTAITAPSRQNNRGDLQWEGGPFDRLQSFTLHADGWPMSLVLPGLVEQAPSLRSLSYYLTSTLQLQARMTPRMDFHQTGLTSLALIDVEPIFPILPSTLQRFIFHPRTAQMGWHGRTSVARSDSRSLTYLSLGNAVMLHPDLLQELLDVHEHEDGTRTPIRDGEPLQHLCLVGDSCPREDPHRFPISRYLLTSSRVLTRSLTSLQLPGQPLNDDDIPIITESTSLNMVDGSSSKLSGLGIKRLVDGAPTLRRINANYCLNVSSRDAIEYAEQRGVCVSYTMAVPCGRGTGRTVRYG